MKRHPILIIIAFLFILLCSGAATAAEPGLDNFTKVNTYFSDQFADVSSSAWYYDNVATAFELGLMKGTSRNYFNTNGSITIAETIALSSRLHSIYNGDGQAFTQGSPWYQVYVTYARQHGIVTKTYDDYTKKATRAEFASILAGALPDEALAAINTVEDGAIPDVATYESYQSAVYKLYRAGVLTGNDAVGTFTPSSNISRSQVAAIVTRMANTSLRQRITLTLNSASKVKLSSTQIYQQCSPAVFYIEVYDENSKALSSGSGFFISADGIAVTNYHVIDGVSFAAIILTDGSEYNVDYVLGYDVEKDIAVIHLDGDNFDYLDVANSNYVASGQKVYAIGSPLGFDNTISEGLISRIYYDGSTISEFQTTAPISHGSSGGALLNEYGEVIGITYAGIEEGQNLNFAIPGNLIDTVDCSKPLTLAEVYAKEYPLANLDIDAYDVCSQVPDFGSLFSAEPVDYWHEIDEYDYYHYYYDYWDIVYATGCGLNGTDDPLEVYDQLLLDWGFDLYNEGSVYNMYTKGSVVVFTGIIDDQLEIIVSP